MQNYAIECTCQTKLKVCVSVYDLISWRRGQTTVAVTSAYTRTLVGTTHSQSDRATVSDKTDLLLRHEKTCTCTWYYVCFSGKFHFRFGFWLATHHEQGQQAYSFQHSWRKEFQWLRYDEARNVMWCESCDSVKKWGFKLHNRNTFIETIGCTSLVSESRHSTWIMDINLNKEKSTSWQNFIDLLVLYSLKIIPLVYMLQQFDYHHDFTK